MKHFSYMLKSNKPARFLLDLILCAVVKFNRTVRSFNNGYISTHYRLTSPKHQANVTYTDNISEDVRYLPCFLS